MGSHYVYISLNQPAVCLPQTENFMLIYIKLNQLRIIIMRNSILFSLGSFHSLLVNQGQNWKKKISPQFRFVLHWMSAMYALLIGLLFTELPDGAVMFLLNNLHEPLSIILLLIMAMFSMAAAFATHISIKLRSSL